MKKEHNKKDRIGKTDDSYSPSSPVCFAASDELRAEYRDSKEDDEKDDQDTGTDEESLPG